MRRTVIVSAASMLLGCVHQTVHEYCTENAARYRDYDQCYAECSASGACTNRGARQLGAVLNGMGAGLAQTPPPPQPAPTQCISTVNGQQVYTTCQ